MQTVLRSAAVAALMLATVSAASAAPRQYDCSKAGNANKAVCKAAAPALAAPATAAVTTAKAPRAAPNYDCTKAGNKTKAACKGASAASSPATQPAAAASATSSPAPSPIAPRTAASAAGSPRIVAWTEKNGKVVHYDCSKAGNLNKKACKQ